MSVREEYWLDPSGNIRRMSEPQDIIATLTDDCTPMEIKALLKGLHFHQVRSSATEPRQEMEGRCVE